MEKDRNATFTKFGGPGTLIADYEHWCVLARPKQVTLGALVLLSDSPHERFSDLPLGAFTELSQVTADLEAAIGRFVSPEKMNYLMLMMVDPHVHFHVLPRYSDERRFADTAFPDTGWPGPPDLSSGVSDADVVEAVRSEIASLWPVRA
ncbi:HIT family protein [Henriciella aquimarina]|uniref:HIT family protein n=1 Tax=Henriciella aquimarina TaxID=545261 RepID=UPI0009FFDF80